MYPGVMPPYQFESKAGADCSFEIYYFRYDSFIKFEDFKQQSSRLSNSDLITLTDLCLQLYLDAVNREQEVINTNKYTRQVHASMCAKQEMFLTILRNLVTERGRHANGTGHSNRQQAPPREVNDSTSQYPLHSYRLIRRRNRSSDNEHPKHYGDDNDLGSTLGLT